MPKGTKVHSCVQKLMDKGKSKESAIKICQESTGQSYKTGNPPGNSKVGKNKMVKAVQRNIN